MVTASAAAPERALPCGLGAGADAESIGVTGLELGTGAQALGAQRTGDIAALATLVESHLGGVAEIELLPVPAKEASSSGDTGEVAGRAVCGSIDITRVTTGGARVRFLAPSSTVRIEMAAGAASLEARRWPEARIAFAAAAAADESPVAGPGLAVATSYALEGRAQEAVVAFADIASRFARVSWAWRGLGDAERYAEHRGAAVDAWARAIALTPADTELARLVAVDPFAEVRPRVPPPALRDLAGRWRLLPLRVPAGQRAVSHEAQQAAIREAKAYARCKEGFRSSAALREAFVGRPVADWRWSPAEERACTAVWLRTYQSHRDAGRPEDAGLDDLLGIAQRGYLGERGLFDVGASEHPLAPLLLDDRALDRYFAFVASHRVLRRQQGGWLF